MLTCSSNNELAAIHKLLDSDVFIRLLTGYNVRGKLVNVSNKYIIIETKLDANVHSQIIMFDYIVTIELAL